MKLVEHYIMRGTRRLVLMLVARDFSLLQKFSR